MKDSSCSNGFDPSSVPSSSSKSEQFLDEKARIFELYDLGSKLDKSCKQCPDIDDVLSDASGLSNQSASLRLSDVLSDASGLSNQEHDFDAPRTTVHEGRRNANVGVERTVDEWLSMVPRENKAKGFYKRNMKRRIKGDIAQTASQHSKMSVALHSLAGAYNRSKLRRGDRADVGRVIGKTKTNQQQWRHRQSWTAVGTIRLALRQIGARTTQAARITHREIDAIAAVSLSAEDHLDQAAKTLYEGIRCRAMATPWLLQCRHMDATPVKVRFGSLADMLSPFSRYWIHDKSKPRGQQWTCTAAEELIARGVHLPKVGIMELLGQACSLIWLGEAQGRTNVACWVANCRSIACRPRFLQHGGASCLLEAFEQLVPSLSVKHMLSLCTVGVNVVLITGMDGAASCTRTGMAIEEKFEVHNRTKLRHEGSALLIRVPCSAHFIQREMENTGDVKVLTGKLYATAFVAGLTDVQTQMCIELDRLVDNDLQFGFFPDCRPVDGIPSQHLEVILRLLLPAILNRDPGDSLVEETVIEFMMVFNGSIKGLIDRFARDPILLVYL